MHFVYFSFFASHKLDLNSFVQIQVFMQQKQRRSALKCNREGERERERKKKPK
jgi:hypothetical protein